MASLRVLCLFLVCAVLMVILTPASAENFSQRRRRTKEVDDKINKLDDATKQRIHAMKASGMPDDAIADKISYVAGGKSSAKRIVEAMGTDNKKKASPSTASASSTTKAKAKLPPKPTQQQKAKQPTTTSSANTKRK